MGTKTFNNYEDLLTFTRASKGHALRPVSYGNELVTNGDFSDGSTGWGFAATSPATVTISGGKATIVSPSGESAYITQSVTQRGKLYTISADVTIRSGAVKFQIGSGNAESYSISTSGRHSANLIAGGTDDAFFIARNGACDADIDNVSIKEVTFDQPDGTLTLFEHPNNIPRVEWVVNTEKTKFKNISSEILSAVGTQEPQATEFNVLVNGQKIGDITNNGTVSAFDASMYISWFEGSLTNQTYIDYIENVLNPYIETNLSKYLVDAPVGRQRAGLLVEESRTNLVRYSDFNLGWDDAATDVRTINAGTAPDGTNTATEFNCASGGFLYDAITVTASTKYTFSWYAKAGTATAHVFAFYDESNSAFVQQQAYTLTGGEYVGNGWYRISRTVTTPAGCTSIRVYPLRANDGGGGVSGAIGTTLIWGAQFEEGSFATSYIKTTGATASRSADIADINTADFGYNLAEGTVVCEFNIKYDNGGSGFPRVWEIGNNGSSADRINTYIAESNGNLAVGINTNTTAQAGATLKTSTGGSVESTVAMGWAKDNFAVSDDGDTVQTDSDIDILPTAFSRNRLKIGGAANTTSDNISGHIKSIKYYPRKLTNAQIEDLSS